MESTSQGEQRWPRLAPTRRLADEWALVLAAEGLSSTVQRERGGFALRVPAHQEEQAARILAAYTRENRPPERPPADPSVSGEVFAGVLVSLALLAFFRVTGPWSQETLWFARGSGDSGRILLGEVWRAVTALTLHADLPHALANAIAGALFLTAVCRSWGQGLGCALVLVAGAGGNLLNAWLRGDPHVAVGASTAVFGAVGILGGMGLVRRRRRGARGRRSWAPIAAALALLAMLGTAGERVDLGAHLTGLLVGGLLGLAVAAAVSRPPGAAVQWSLGGAAIAAVLLCWWLALQAGAPPEQVSARAGLRAAGLRPWWETAPGRLGETRRGAIPSGEDVPPGAKRPAVARGAGNSGSDDAAESGNNRPGSFVKLCARGASFDRRTELGSFPSLRVSNRVCLPHLARLAASLGFEPSRARQQSVSHGIPRLDGPAGIAAILAPGGGASSGREERNLIDEEAVRRKPALHHQRGRAEGNVREARDGRVGQRDHGSRDRSPPRLRVHRDGLRRR